MNLRRREALAIGVGGAVAAGILPARGAEPLLKAVVSLQGRNYEFRQENGVDLGDFASPIGGFTQRCIRVDLPGFPLSVFFRPDRDGQRVEVVFELGRLWSGAPDQSRPMSALIARRFSRAVNSWPPSPRLRMSGVRVGAGNRRRGQLWAMFRV